MVGADIASEKAWTEPCELGGKKYLSAQDHFVEAMKQYTNASVVDAAVNHFGARTLAVALFSRRNLGNPKVDQVDLTPEVDIKAQAAKIYEALSIENKRQYTAVLIIYCFITHTLIDRIDERNRKAMAEGRKEDVRLVFFPFADTMPLLAKLGFAAGEESISVVPRIQCDELLQTGSHSSQELAEMLCEKAFNTLTNTHRKNI